MLQLNHLVYLFCSIELLVIVVGTAEGQWKPFEDLNGLNISETVKTGSIVFQPDVTNKTRDVFFFLYGTDYFRIDSTNGAVIVNSPLDFELMRVLQFTVGLYFLRGNNKSIEYEEWMQERNVSVFIKDQNDMNPVFETVFETEKFPMSVKIDLRKWNINTAILKGTEVSDADTVGDDLTISCLPFNHSPDACSVVTIITEHSSIKNAIFDVFLSDRWEYQPIHFALSASDGQQVSAIELFVQLANITEEDVGVLVTRGNETLLSEAFSSSNSSLISTTGSTVDTNSSRSSNFTMEVNFTIGMIAENVTLQEHANVTIDTMNIANVTIELLNGTTFGNISGAGSEPEPEFYGNWSTSYMNATASIPEPILKPEAVPEPVIESMENVTISMNETSDYNWTIATVNSSVVITNFYSEFVTTNHSIGGPEELGAANATFMLDNETMFVNMTFKLPISMAVPDDMTNLTSTDIIFVNLTNVFLNSSMESPILNETESTNATHDMKWLPMVNFVNESIESTMNSTFMNNTVEDTEMLMLLNTLDNATTFDNTSVICNLTEPIQENFNHTSNFTSITTDTEFAGNGTNYIAISENLTVVSRLEEIKHFKQNKYVVVVVENVPADTIILLLRPSSKEITVVDYQLAGDSSETFGISITGALFVVGKLDYERRFKYDFSVYANSTLDAVNFVESKIEITIMVRNVNDNAPKFERSYYMNTFAEDRPINSTLFQFEAYDIDSENNSLITYTLVHVPPEIQGFIELDENTGVLINVKSFQDKVGIHYFRVEAVDVGDLRTTVDVKFRITKAARCLPTITTPKSSARIIYVKENSPIGTFITKFGAVSDPTCTTEFKLLDADDSTHFILDIKNGNLTLATVLDREVQESYSASIAAVDVASGVQTSQVAIEVRLSDEDDSEPMFLVQGCVYGKPEMVEMCLTEKTAKYKFRVVENGAKETVVGTLRANDMDKGKNADFYFYLINSDKFTIDSETGQIYALVKFDYESYVRYSFQAVVIPEPGLSNAEVISYAQNYNLTGVQFANITVTITNSDEYEPEFEREIYEAAVLSATVPPNELVYLPVKDWDSKRDTYYRVRKAFYTNSLLNKTFNVNSNKFFINSQSQIQANKTFSRYQDGYFKLIVDISGTKNFNSFHSTKVMLWMCQENDLVAFYVNGLVEDGSKELVSSFEKISNITGYKFKIYSVNEVEEQEPKLVVKRSVPRSKILGIAVDPMYNRVAEAADVIKAIDSHSNKIQSEVKSLKIERVEMEEIKVQNEVYMIATPWLGLIIALGILVIGIVVIIVICCCRQQCSKKDKTKSTEKKTKMAKSNKPVMVMTNENTVNSTLSVKPEKSTKILHGYQRCEQQEVQLKLGMDTIDNPRKSPVACVDVPDWTSYSTFSTFKLGDSAREQSRELVT